MTKRTPLTALFAATLCSPAFADGDAAAGKETFEANCERCHYSDDYTHEAESVVAAMIKAIRSGETRHRPALADLTDEEIANLAAFLANQ